MIQPIINMLYRIPLSRYKNVQRLGGFLSYYKMRVGRKKMERASSKIPPILSQANGLPIYFLTGKNHLYQTLFCAYSLIKFSQDPIQFTLVDDGSFDATITTRINRQMPGAKIVTREAIEANFLKMEFRERYPYLYNKRKVYPHIKKLTDVHTIPDNVYKLVLDSDMLFWKNPEAMLNWLKNPSHSLHMVDCEQSYGYSIDLMKKLSGGTLIPDKINVGAIGLNSNDLNWTMLNDWVQILEQEEGTSYFLEQAISAMIMAKQSKTRILNSTSYIVNPQKMLETDILHHYVDLSKKYYFEKAWKIMLEDSIK